MGICSTFLCKSYCRNIRCVKLYDNILSGTMLMDTNMLILQREIDEVCARYKTVFPEQHLCEYLCK
jgi:hypothetical protein